MTMKRVWNFSAGPAALPVEVLEEASGNVVCAENCGMSIMEMSHRSKGWVEFQEETTQSLSTLLSLPDTHDILFLQGGATSQFAMVPSVVEFFDGLVALSYKKAYMDWIKSAKKEKTRQRRIAKAVELLSDGKKLK